jgi:Protein of unknown function (DUF4232)
VIPRVDISGAGRLAAAGAFIWIAAVAGCASSSSPSAAPASPPSASSPAAAGSTPVTAPSSAATPGPSACATNSLRVKLGLAQGYAGGVYEVIDFTNASAAPCTLYGYPGVSLVSAPPYTQIGLAAKRDTTAKVKLVTLAPGAAANALLQIVDALNFPTATCSPVKAAYLRIYPPNQTAPVYLANPVEACSKPVQTLFIGAVQANGQAHPMATATGVARRVSARRTGCSSRGSRRQLSRRSPSRPAARRRPHRRCRACGDT